MYYAAATSQNRRMDCGVEATLSGYNGRVILVALALLATGCVDSEPSRYAGLRVGMSKEAAFDLACERTRRGEFQLAPVFYTSGQRRRSNRNESICDLRAEATAAQQWELVEPGLRDRFIILDFEDGRLKQVKLQWRGWDP